MPARVIATIPKGIALLNRGAMRMEISTRPVAASRTSGSEILPNPTYVAGLAMIIFALRKPINAINKPMPAAVPCLRQSGMALTTCSRMLLSVSKTPERNTTPSAVFHGTPRPRTME